MTDIKHHKNYHALNKMWTKCRDVLEGEDKIKEKSTAYLPMLKGQDAQEYDAYLQRGAFYGATFKTSSALSGMATRKTPRMINSNPELNAWVVSDFDEQHNDIWRFSTRAVEEKINTGRVGILVEMPELPANGTLADQKKKTPYMSMFLAEQIINWHFNDKNLPDYIVLETKEDELKLLASGVYDTEEVTKTVVLVLDENGDYLQIHYVDEIEVKRVYPVKNGKRIKEIPFFFMDMDDTADKPPLYDIVNLNIRHYRLYADFSHLLHFTSIPTLCIYGAQLEQGASLAIGSEKAMVFPNPEAKAEWIKAGSDGAEPIKNELIELENRMAAIGAQILQDRVDRETAQAAQLRNSYNTSFLSLLVSEISTVITKAIKFGAWWAGINVSPDFRYELDTDFNSKMLPAAELQVLVQAYQAGSLSLESFVYNLERGEYLAPGTSVEEEMGRIEDAEPQPTQVKVEMTGAVPGTPKAPKSPKESTGGQEPG